MTGFWYSGLSFVINKKIQEILCNQKTSNNNEQEILHNQSNQFGALFSIFQSVFGTQRNKQ